MIAVLLKVQQCDVLFQLLEMKLLDVVGSSGNVCKSIVLIPIPKR